MKSGSFPGRAKGTAERGARSGVGKHPQLLLSERHVLRAPEAAFPIPAAKQAGLVRDPVSAVTLTFPETKVHYCRPKVNKPEK